MFKSITSYRTFPTFLLKYPVQGIAKTGVQGIALLFILLNFCIQLYTSVMKNIFYFSFSLFSITIQSNPQCRAKVSAGNASTLALIRNGTLWAWGGNFFGLPGDETKTIQNQF